MLIYESGTIGSKPTRLPLSIGDGELAETADSVVPVPEIFNYWLQGGRIDVGFLGAAQIDRFGNLNTTVIGAYDEPEGAPARRRRRARDRRAWRARDHDHPPVPAHVRRTSWTSRRRSAPTRRAAALVITRAVGVITDLRRPDPTASWCSTDAAPRRDGRPGAGGDRLGAGASRTTLAARPSRRPRTSCRVLRELQERMSDVFIVDAVRTPIGKIGGALAGARGPTTWPPPSCGRWSSATDLDPETIDEVLLRRRQRRRRGQPQRRAHGGAARRPPDLGARARP